MYMHTHTYTHTSQPEMIATLYLYKCNMVFLNYRICRNNEVSYSLLEKHDKKILTRIMEMKTNEDHLV